MAWKLRQRCQGYTRPPRQHGGVEGPQQGGAVPRKARALGGPSAAGRPLGRWAWLSLYLI